MPIPSPTRTPTITPTPTPVAPALSPAPGWVLARFTSDGLELPSDQVVEISVELLSNAIGVSAAELQLSFDPKSLQVVAMEPGDLLGISPLVGVHIIDNEKGVARIALARLGPTSPPTAPGVLARVKLRALPGEKPQETALRMASLKVTDHSFTAVRQLATLSPEVPVRIPQAPGK